MAITPSLVFDRYLVTLELKRPVRFHLNHGGVMRGLLSRALEQHELPSGIVPTACESGRSCFDAGDRYHIGLTLAGDSRRLADSLSAALERIGAEAASGGPAPTLGGNFIVLGFHLLPPAPTATMVDALSHVRNLTLRFVSPLRMKRPPDLKTNGEQYFNATCFPAELFLQRLFQRLFMLERGRYPDKGEIAQSCPGLD